MEQYESLRQKHSLPPLDVMDREFEISTIEEEAFLLRAIRNRVDEKIESATKILDALLHPDAGFSAYRESSVFDDKDREGIIEIYKSLMFFKRQATLLEFDDSDEANAAFINDFMQWWSENRGILLRIIRQLRDSWKTDISRKDVVAYLG